MKTVVTTKNVFCLVLCALLFIIGGLSNAQQPRKTIRIGELVFRGSEGSSLGEGRHLFRRALHDRGYIEGKNIIFETRSAEGKLDRFPVLADELVRLIGRQSQSSKVDRPDYSSAGTGKSRPGDQVRTTITQEAVGKRKKFNSVAVLFAA